MTEEQNNNLPTTTTKPFEYALELNNAIYKDEWEVANKIFTDGFEMNTPISESGKTALHIAAQSGKTYFVEKMIGRMNVKGTLEMLEEKDNKGHTALYLAVKAGDYDAVKLMVDHRPELPLVSNDAKETPILEAARLGHWKLLKYLFITTQNRKSSSNNASAFEGEAGVKLLKALIAADFYVDAKCLVENYPKVAIIKENYQSALHMLARKPDATESGAKDGFFSRNYSYLYPLAGYLRNIILTPPAINNSDPGASTAIPIAGDMDNPQVELVKCICKEIAKLKNLNDINDLVSDPFLDAAEYGAVKFMETCFNYFPHMIRIHHKSHTILHICIINRQEKVFKLLCTKWSGYLTALASYIDTDGNNILHLAAQLAPSGKLKLVPGAALQMQREMQWYKAVEAITQPTYKEMENKNGKKPHALFVEEHITLLDNAEKWMRSTATSSSLVATLMCAMVFGVVFNVPGGYYGQNETNLLKGTPVLIGSKIFQLFALSAACALASALSTVLIYLSDLTSRYTEEDFLVTIPNKILYGLAALFLSIKATALTFIFTYMIMFSNESNKVQIFVGVLAASPIILFLLFHVPLFKEVIKSTHLRGDLHRR